MPATATTPTHTEFLRWYEPLHERFARYCATRAFGLLQTEDLVQEAVLAALQGWDRLRDKDRLLSYMIGIVNNLVRNHHRRGKFRAEWDEERLARLENRLGGDAELALDVHYLLRALEALPAEQREAIELFEISGFSIREVADIQQTTEGAVKTRLSRARRTLRETLSEDGRALTLGERLRIYATILL